MYVTAHRRVLPGSMSSQCAEADAHGGRACFQTMCSLIKITCCARALIAAEPWPHVPLQGLATLRTFTTRRVQRLCMHMLGRRACQPTAAQSGVINPAQSRRWNGLRRRALLRLGADVPVVAVSLPKPSADTGLQCVAGGVYMLRVYMPFTWAAQILDHVNSRRPRTRAQAYLHSA